VSEFDAKREEAMRLLDRAGIWRSNYLPPAVRLLWHWGFHTPLPHFLSFSQVTVWYGLLFAVFWGLGMWLLRGFGEGFAPSDLARASCGSGIIFGLSMACYYAYGRRRHNLPRWSELGHGPVDAA
jgi:hypothetical protein